MADKDEKKPKKQSTIKQIIQIYKYTSKDDKQLPWLLAGAILAPVVVAVIIGLIFQWNWLNWIFIIIAAIMLGLLFGTMTLTNRADKVGYRQLEGRPGAAIGVLSNMNKAGFNFPEQPVWVDPRTKDAIWRGSGRTGVYLVGEGDYHRVMRAIDREENKIKSITRGSAIPIYKFSVGDGPAQIKLRDLQKKVMRQKVKLTKAELDELNNRLRTLQEHKGYGIPKGIDPTRPQRVSRRAMRGR